MSGPLFVRAALSLTGQLPALKQILCQRLSVRLIPRIGSQECVRSSPGRFQETVVVHPALSRQIAQHVDAATGHERELEDLPLRVADVALLRGDTAFLPDDRDLPVDADVTEAAQVCDAAVVPLELRPHLLGSRGLNGFGAGAVDPPTRISIRLELNHEACPPAC